MSESVFDRSGEKDMCKQAVDMCTPFGAPYDRRAEDISPKFFEYSLIIANAWYLVNLTRWDGPPAKFGLLIFDFGVKFRSFPVNRTY